MPVHGTLTIEPVYETLTLVSFALDGARLVAVGNFWQKGEAFFRLRLAGLDPDRRYDATLNGDYLGTFTGAAWRGGVLAQAGALRWSFILVEPSAGAPRGEPLPMEALMGERLPAIEEAFAREEDWVRRYADDLDRERQTGDLATVSPVAAGGVTLTPGTDGLTLAAGRYRARLDPAGGGRLIEWRGGETALSLDADGFGMGLDAFVWPRDAGSIIRSGYAVAAAAADGDAVKVVLKRTLTRNDSISLIGMTITKTWRFANDAVEVISEIANDAGEESMTFAFRFHNMPALLSDGGGEAVFGDGVAVQRDHLLKLFRFAAPDPDLEGVYPEARTLAAASGEVEFRHPGAPVRLRASFPPERIQFVAFWDSGNNPCSTFEPVFRKATLAPGKSVAYSLRWVLE